jgi:hypothetical protein
VHVPASFHLTDALYGLAVGTVATAAAILWARRTRSSRTGGNASDRIGAIPVLLAAIAGLIAMYAARAVRRGLIDDIATGPAIAVVVVGIVAGLGWAWVAPRLTPVWLAALVMLSAAGVWAAVPDTETAVAVLAAWLPFALSAAAYGRSSPAATTSLSLPAVLAWIALAIVLAWAAAWGADAEPASLPGALACFGIALVVPWVAATVRGELRVSWLLPSQLVAVIVAARWATNVSSTGAGMLRSLAVLALLTAVVAVSYRSAVPVRRLPSDRPEHPR